MKQRKNTSGDVIKVGMTVRLRRGVEQSHRCPEGRENWASAEVWSIGKQGEAMLNRDLRGCRHWNADDLRPAKVKPAVQPVPEPVPQYCTRHGILQDVPSSRQKAVLYLSQFGVKAKEDAANRWITHPRLADETAARLMGFLDGLCRA